MPPSRDSAPRPPFRTTSGKCLFYVQYHDHMSVSTGVNSFFGNASELPGPSGPGYSRFHGSDPSGVLDHYLANYKLKSTP